MREWHSAPSVRTPTIRLPVPEQKTEERTRWTSQPPSRDFARAIFLIKLLTEGSLAERAISHVNEQRRRLGHRGGENDRDNACDRASWSLCPSNDFPFFVNSVELRLRRYHEIFSKREVKVIAVRSAVALGQWRKQRRYPAEITAQHKAIITENSICRFREEEDQNKSDYVYDHKPKNRCDQQCAKNACPYLSFAPESYRPRITQDDRWEHIHGREERKSKTEQA